VYGFSLSENSLVNQQITILGEQKGPGLSPATFVSYEIFFPGIVISLQSSFSFLRCFEKELLCSNTSSPPSSIPLPFFHPSPLNVLIAAWCMFPRRSCLKMEYWMQLD
jgi:hypothetical protein